MEGAAWSSNTTATFTGQVLSWEGSLGFDSVDLFRDSNASTERGFVYGLVAPNGSGKTSLARALPELPGFPTRFRFEYLSADLTTERNDGTARDFCQRRVDERLQVLEREVEDLESRLEDVTDNETLEVLSSQLGELIEMKEDMELSAATKVKHMFSELGFGSYADMSFASLSSGWKYKCQLISALVISPDLLVVDEPCFLDVAATQWFISSIQHLTKSDRAMVILISHKEALMDELADRILYLNPASKTLNVYNCGYREFQAAHADKVSHARKSKAHADSVVKDAKQSLSNIQKELKKREQNLKATTSQHADQRFIKGKNKEAKQKADHSAAAKLKRTQKKAAEIAQEEELLREAYVAPLELDGTEGDDRPLLELNDADFKYEDSDDYLLQFMNLQISGSDKVLVQGPNGQGKSTLAKLFLGELEPTSGDLRRHSTTVAHFHQDALLELIQQFGSVSAVEFLRAKDEYLTETDARTYLGRFGLKGNLALRPIQTLSAGQRVRLWLAREFYGPQKPSLLILDEATENLDKDTTDLLLDSLRSFSAAILAISHDEYFCEEYPATQVWTVDQKRVLLEFR